MINFIKKNKVYVTLVCSAVFIGSVVLFFGFRHFNFGNIQPPPQPKVYSEVEKTHILQSVSDQPIYMTEKKDKLRMLKLTNTANGASSTTSIK